MNLNAIIHSFSTIHSGTDEFKSHTPYLVALVEHDQQKRLIRLEGDPEKLNLNIGAEVKLTPCEDSNGQCFRLK